jgi:hypothetical protein
MITARIIKDWEWPDLMRQTPGQLGQWDDVQFTTDPVQECDFAIVLNNRMPADTRLNCPPAHVWAIMQEPYYKGFSDWIIEKHGAFAKVFSHHPATDHDARHHRSHPALPWHVNKTYDQLLAATRPAKTKNLSWVIGDAMHLPGHWQRAAFLDHIRGDPALDLDLYGRAIHYIEDKWDGLAPYRYSLAIENTRGPDYWTEKIADCFLAWTVPIYHGCTNLEDYFPPDSFIRIDISQPAAALAKIKRILADDHPEARIPALEEARQRVLNRHQLFPYVSGLIHAQPATGLAKQAVTIPAYRRSAKAFLNHKLYAARHRLGRL